MDPSAQSTASWAVGGLSLLGTLVSTPESGQDRKCHLKDLGLCTELQEMWGLLTSLPVRQAVSELKILGLWMKAPLSASLRAGQWLGTGASAVVALQLGPAGWLFLGSAEPVPLMVYPVASFGLSHPELRAHCSSYAYRTPEYG